LFILLIELKQLHPRTLEKGDFILFRILKRDQLGPHLLQYSVEAPEIAAKARAGQYVVVRAEKGGERIPLVLTDFDPAAALAALALAATLPLPVQADDPVTPVEGAVCNLYLLDVASSAKPFNEIASSLASQPAAATFVDTASDFKPSRKKDGIASSWGMWTGWLKQETAGTYTFLCKRAYSANEASMSLTLYSIWINGQKCVEAGCGQTSFNVELQAGFNSVKIVAESRSDRDYPLSITYKKAGSVKDPVAFGPENMFHDDED